MSNGWNLKAIKAISDEFFIDVEIWFDHNFILRRSDPFKPYDNWLKKLDRMIHHNPSKASLYFKRGQIYEGLRRSVRAGVEWGKVPVFQPDLFPNWPDWDKESEPYKSTRAELALKRLQIHDYDKAIEIESGCSEVSEYPDWSSISFAEFPTLSKYLNRRDNAFCYWVRLMKDTSCGTTDYEGQIFDEANLTREMFWDPNVSVNHLGVYTPNDPSEPCHWDSWASWRKSVSDRAASTGEAGPVIPGALTLCYAPETPVIEFRISHL